MQYVDITDTSSKLQLEKLYSLAISAATTNFYKQESEMR